MGCYRPAAFIDWLNGRKTEKQLFSLILARKNPNTIFRKCIIRIQEEDHVSLRERQRPIPGAGRSEVERILQERARCEALGKGSFFEDPLRDFEAPIGRVIVDDNELNVGKVLSIDSLQAFLDIRFMLVASDDDAGQHADSPAQRRTMIE
jgi:hypothetical protein